MKKEKKYLIYGIGLVLLSLIGVSLAYFATEIVGNKKQVSVNTGDLRIVFTNGDSITASNVYAEDGFDIIKTFSIENKTNKDYYYDIVIQDLINTTVSTGYLVYKITSTDGGYNMTDFVEVPKSEEKKDVTLKRNLLIKSKELTNYNIEIKYIYSEDVDQSEDMGKTFSGKLYISGSDNKALSLKNAMLLDNGSISTRSDFSVTNEANTTGTIYKTTSTEDGSEVYYYSGNTTNNWIKFGRETKCMYDGNKVEYVNTETSDYREVNNSSECTMTNVCLVKQPMVASVYGDDGYIYSYYVGLTESECQETEGTYLDEKAEWTNFDIYWRIIRTNEDGSVRLLYAGNSHDTTQGYIGESEYNENSDESRYVGYMYGGNASLEDNRTNTTSSTIKTYIDTWYQNNLLTNYDKYISKSVIYCNDRSVGSGTWVNTGTNFYFGAYTRLETNKTPTYKCGGNGSGGLFESTQVIEDKFSASTTGGGNGQLTYPVALMTADEISYAGGVDGEELSSPYAYYYTNSAGESIIDYSGWWLLSPESWFYGESDVYYVRSSYDPGYIIGNYVNGNYAVRPVISINQCAQVTGTGTPEDPYIIDENANTC